MQSEPIDESFQTVENIQCRKEANEKFSMIASVDFIFPGCRVGRRSVQQSESRKLTLYYKEIEMP
jgi:hypothetical protein